MVPPSSDTSFDSNGMSQQPYYMNGKIIISALIILLIIVLFIMVLHIYAKCFGRRQITSRRIAAATSTVWHYAQESHVSAAAPGLEKAVVDAMPVFIFKALPSKASSMASTAVECAVCLSEFQNCEKCRLLPNCGHSFHTECIDMWFSSNTTCPVCRTHAEPRTAESIPPGFEPLEGIVMPENTTFDHTDATAERVSGSRSGLGGSLDDISATALLLQRTINANARSWRRSISDRFTGVSESVQFPTNVLFWGNHSQMSSRVNSDHWQVGGRSMPHIVIDVAGAAQQQEGLLSGSAMQHHSSPSTRPFQRFKSLRRLLSRERKVPPAEDEAASCSCSHGALPNT